MAQKATISVTLYKSKTYANGDHPLCIRLTKDGKRRYRTLKGITCHPKHWNEKKNEPRKNHPDKINLDEIINNTLRKYSQAQNDLLAEGKEVTPERIISKVEKPIEKTTVLEFYDKMIRELSAKGKISNAKHYNDIKKQFENFLREKNKREILFSDIDYNLLNDWETYLKQRGAKDTTLFGYFKNLRALYREAIKRDAAKEDNYPFNEYKLSKFNLQTEKRAIQVQDIQAIETLDVSDELPSVVEAKQYALFSYYAFGINLTDMAYLRWGDITNGFIYYQRKKTGKFINVPLLDRAKEIIDYFRPVTENSPFVFPILQPERHQTPTQKANRIQKVRTRTNKALKEIARKVEIEGNITMYTFRHSFATHLYRKGVPASIIQQALSHETEKQTRTYLAELGADELVEYAKKLVNE